MSRDWKAGLGGIVSLGAALAFAGLCAAGNPKVGWSGLPLPGLYTAALPVHRGEVMVGAVVAAALLGALLDRLSRRRRAEVAMALGFSGALLPWTALQLVAVRGLTPTLQWLAMGQAVIFAFGLGAVCAWGKEWTPLPRDPQGWDAP